MKMKYEDLIRFHINRFARDMTIIAEGREDEELKQEPTTIHFDPSGDDSDELPIGMHISVDPRRLEPGEDGLGGDGTFLVRVQMSSSGFATFVSKLVEYALSMGIEGDSRDHPSIVIDEEMY